ncbi:MAG: cysteine-rich CWC family protein [Pseudorhodoplanes sp.]
MSGRPESAVAVSQRRSLACARCGTAFECDPQGGCWCAGESFRLPLPTNGEDCLCPDCLRALARRQTGQPA